MHALQARSDRDYPESDGMPMGETDVHKQWMIRLYDLLRYHYRRQRVYVGSDILLYYTEGLPYRFVVPDNFVVLDCDPGQRRIFQTWKERRVPTTVIEVTSRYTRKRDQTDKPEIYAEIGVRELFLYDPTGDYLKPPLAGFRLTKRRQRPIEPDATGALDSRELGLSLRLDKRRLVIVDRETGQPLLTEAEAAWAAHEASQAARDEEQAARIAAEARAIAAEAELERLRRRVNRGKNRDT